MKTRTGFVSNSSSSSFVIGIGVGKPFTTALDVAEHMIPFREWDGDQDLLNKIAKLKQGRAKALNAVCFKSCNYDTFIVKMGNIFLVETCHNHKWDLSKYQAECPPEFYDYFGDDSFYNLSSCFDFFHLEYDVMGRPGSWRETKDFEYYCQSCNSYNNGQWIIKEEIQCPKCGAPPIKRKN
jgi:hypothetical protein